MWSKLVGTGGKGLPPLGLRLSNFLGYWLLILVNVLSSMGAFGGTNSDISRKYPTPLTPSGWAFSIWGIIFALEGVGVVYGILNSGYREGGWKTTLVTRLGFTWQAGWMCQNLWQIFFSRESLPGMYLAFACLLGALCSFMLGLQRLNGVTHELRARGASSMSPLAYAAYKLPTSINTAWLSVATALGLLIIPVAHGASQASLVVPSAVLAVAVTAVGVWRVVSSRDAAYGLTLIWALSAVAAKEGVAGAVKGVGIGCLVAVALCVVHALVRSTREELSVSGGAGGGMGGAGVLVCDAELGMHRSMSLGSSLGSEGGTDPRVGDRALMLPPGPHLAGYAQPNHLYSDSPYYQAAGYLSGANGAVAAAWGFGAAGAAKAGVQGYGMGAGSGAEQGMGLHAPLYPGPDDGLAGAGAGTGATHGSAAGGAYAGDALGPRGQGQGPWSGGWAADAASGSAAAGRASGGASPRAGGAARGGAGAVSDDGGPEDDAQGGAGGKRVRFNDDLNSFHG